VIWIQRVKPLLFGLDKLEGSIEIADYMDAAGEMIRKLKTLKADAQTDRQPAPYRIGKREFLVQPKGRLFYELTLKHPDFILWLADFERQGTPPVLVSISSEYLWAVGPVRALKEVYATLTTAGIPPNGNHCSRFDLMLDYCGRELGFRDLYDIVCTSRKRLPLDGNFLASDEVLGHVGQRQRTKGLSVDDGLDVRQYAIQRKGKTELTGLVVALGQPLSWRGYNKLLEIERVSGKWWFLDIWRDNGWEPDEEGNYPTVFRSEFQVRREAITDMAPILGDKLDTMEDVIKRVAEIWRYLTGEWLLFKHRKGATNISRAPVRLWWRQIQQPTIDGVLPIQVDWATIDPVERLGRLRKSKRQVLDRMMAGCLATIAAHQGTPADFTATVETWAESVAGVLGEMDTAEFYADWGRKARKRAMEQLIADLKFRLKCKLQDPDARLPDLAAVLAQWRMAIPPEMESQFKKRSKVAEGQLNDGKEEAKHVGSPGNRKADEGS
jgi:hypothetical protein